MKRPSWLVVALAGQVAAVVGFGVARGNRRVIAYLIVWSLLALLIRAGHRRWPLPRATLIALAVAGAVHLAGGLLPFTGAGCADLLRDVARPGRAQVRPGRPRLHLGRRHRRRVPGARPRRRRRPGRAGRSGRSWPCWSAGASARPTSCSSSSRPSASPTPTSAASTTPAGTSPSTPSAGVLAAIGCAALTPRHRHAGGGGRPGTATRWRPGVRPPSASRPGPRATTGLRSVRRSRRGRRSRGRRCRPRRRGGWRGGSPTPALSGRPATFGARARANVGALTAGTVNSAATGAPRPSSAASCDTHDECRSPLSTSASPRRRASRASRRSRSCG